MMDGAEELNRLEVDLGVAAVRVGARAAAVVHKIAADIEGTGKQLVSVDTGATKNSIGVDVSGDGRFGEIEAVIGPTTEYAVYLERGTATMAPHAFMGPALDRHAPDFVAALEHVAGDIL